MDNHPRAAEIHRAARPRLRIRRKRFRTQRGGNFRQIEYLHSALRRPRRRRPCNRRADKRRVLSECGLHCAELSLIALLQHGLYPAHAGTGGLLLLYLERTQLAGMAGMRAATDLL